MWRCFSSGLVVALLVTLLVAWSQGLEHVMPPKLDAIAASHADDAAAPACCATGMGQTCQAGCSPAKAAPLPGDRAAGTIGPARPEQIERLDEQRPAPDPMPPEPSRA